MKDSKSTTEQLVLLSWCPHCVLWVLWGVYLGSHPLCWTPTRSWSSSAEILESVFCFNFICDKFSLWHFESKVQLTGRAVKFTAKLRQELSHDLQETLDTREGVNSLASCSVPAVGSQFPGHCRFKECNMLLRRRESKPKSHLLWELLHYCD